MAEREAIYKLKFLVDKSGQQESVRAIDALGKEFTELDKNAQMVSKSAQNAVAKLSLFDKGRAELQATADEAKQAAIATDGYRSALENAADASKKMKRVRDEVKEAREEIDKAATSTDKLRSRLDAADENFDVVSRRVGLAGDVQSNLGAVRGLSDMAGLGAVGQGIGVAGEIAALTEELPRLKAAAAQLPSIIKFAYQEIGAKGAGLIGALGALAIVAALAAKSQEENRQKAEGAIAGLREYYEVLQSGTRATVAAQIAAYQAELGQLKGLQEAQEEKAKTENKTFDQLQEAADFIGKGAIGFDLGAQGAIKLGKEVGVFGQEAKVAEDAVSETAGQIAELEGKIKALTDALDDNQLVINEQIMALEASKNKQADALAEQTELQRKSIEFGRAANLEQYNERIQAIETDRKLYTELVNSLLSIQDPTEEIVGNIATYKNALLDLNEQQQALTYTALPLIEIRERETTSTEAAASAISNLTSALGHQEDVVKERIAQIKEQAQNELEFSRFLKNASVDSVTSRIEALQEEATALRSMLPELQKLAPTSEAAAKELQATTDRLGEIDAELRRIGSEGVIAAIQREQAELTAEIIKIEAARDEKIAQIRETAARKEAELYQDLQQDLADAVADANDERIEAQREYQEEAAEIERDLARKRLDIEKKYSRDAANAVGDRDALALYQAKQTRDDGLEDAEEAAAQQRADLQRNYALQLDTINRELAKQQQALQAKYAQQLNDLRMATTNSINLERQKAAQEIAVRQQAYQQELAQLNSFAQGGVASVAAFATNSLTTLAGFVESARSIMSGLIAGASIPNSTPSPVPSGPVPGRTGGPQPYPGVNINVAGYTIPVIQQQIYDVLKDLFP